jgi:hypothetical protein
MAPVCRTGLNGPEVLSHSGKGPCPITAGWDVMKVTRGTEQDAGIRSAARPDTTQSLSREKREGSLSSGHGIKP